MDTAQSVKSEAGNRVSSGSVPGRSRSPKVSVRFARETSTNRERAPTTAVRIFSRCLESRATETMICGLPSGTMRQGVWQAFEAGECWTQKCSTKPFRS
jgi:hypothetical protein